MPALDAANRRALKTKSRELPTPKKTKAEKQAEKQKRPSVRRPGPRGWLGRARGEASVIQPADEWRGTTVQVCGLWPFAAGTGSPMVGVPIGCNMVSGSTLCCDPVSWFQRGNLISQPSMFVLGPLSASMRST